MHLSRAAPEVDSVRQCDHCFDADVCAFVLRRFSIALSDDAQIVVQGAVRAGVARTQLGDARYQTSAHVDVKEHPGGFTAIGDQDRVALSCHLHGAGDIAYKLSTGLSSRALLLTRYGRLNVSAEDALQCRQLIEEFGGDAQVSDLLEQGLSEATIWNLVARHQLKVPVGLPMTETSSVCINNHVEEDCHDYFCSWLGAPTR